MQRIALLALMLASAAPTLSRSADLDSGATPARPAAQAAVLKPPPDAQAAVVESPAADVETHPAAQAADVETPPAAPAADVSPLAGPQDSSARDAAFRYRITVDAPSALRPLIESTVGLVRWQDYADMTQVLFDRLARDAIGEAQQASAALGWFSAAAEVRVDTAHDPATVTLVVTPGEPTRIRDVRIDVNGDAARDEPAGTDAIARLQADWRLPRGETFTQSRWTLAKNNATFALASAGYAAAKITASEAAIDPDAFAADLAVTLESGPLFRFGELRIHGIKRYDEDLIRNFSTLHEGERYDAHALDQFVRRLNATGYFASVQATVNPDPEHAGAAPVDIAVIEAPTRRLDAGIGYSTDTRFRANINYRDVDIDGHARQMVIDARLEEALQSASVRLTAPPDRSGWVDSVSAQAERTDIENLVTKTAVAGVRRQSVDERDNWAFGAAFYFDQQMPQGAPSATSHALYTDVVRTWRRTDDLIAPTQGFNVALQTGAGIPGLSTRGFGRVIAQAILWQPVARNLDLTLRAEAGAVIAASRDGIPSALLFRTGGDTSVRGYAFESLGVKNGDAIVPGRYYAVASGEATRWFGDNWGIATFVDAGNAVDEPRDLRHLALGYGAGLRLRTPIGPFRLDVAYGQDVHKVRLHFSVGLAF